MLYSICCILEYMASIHHGNLIGDVPAFLSPLINGAPKLSAMISTANRGRGSKGEGICARHCTIIHRLEATEKAVDYGTLPYNLSSVPCWHAKAMKVLEVGPAAARAAVAATAAPAIAARLVAATRQDLKALRLQRDSHGTCAVRWFVDCSDRSPLRG
jgi:hypothetical protein